MSHIAYSPIQSRKVPRVSRSTSDGGVEYARTDQSETEEQYSEPWLTLPLLKDEIVSTLDIGLPIVFNQLIGIYALSMSTLLVCGRLGVSLLCSTVPLIPTTSAGPLILMHLVDEVRCNAGYRCVPGAGVRECHPRDNICERDRVVGVCGPG